MISFFDLKQQTALFKKEILEEVEKVVDDCAFSGGKYVRTFEENFASFCKASYTAGVNSGTSALHLSLKALDIGQGDEVLLPTNSFIATAWAVSYVGAKIVFVDCDPKTWNIDVKSIEAKITNKTKAILCVHLYGSPCDMNKLLEIKEKHALYLIEDCAQAHGAEFEGKKVGNFGEVGAFSFYPSKNLGAFGESGAVVTKNKAIFERIKRLRNQGISQKYHYNEISYNMRMDGIQAAVLNIKLQYLEKWNKRRQKIAESYVKSIKKPLQYQLILTNANSVYHLFVITVENRGKFIDFLNSSGISVGLHYPIPIHLQNAYRQLGHKRGDFPNSESLSDHCVSLPMYPQLSSDQIERVIEVINSYTDQ